MHAFLQALVIAGNLADASTTIVATNRPGVHESNPLMDTRGKMIAWKAEQSAAEGLAVGVLWKRGHHQAAIWTTVGVVGVNGWVAVHNLHQGRR